MGIEGDRGWEGWAQEFTEVLRREDILRMLESLASSAVLGREAG